MDSEGGFPRITVTAPVAGSHLLRAGFNTYSFLSCFTSSHVGIPRACPNDGRAASFDVILCLHPVDPLPSHPSLSCLLRYSLRHSEYLRQPRFIIPRFSAVLCSQSTLSASKNAFRFFPVSYDFSVLFFSHHLFNSSSSRPLPFPSGHF
jgi:hypothetical protein